jgi:outer membrane protein assembly factor BamE
MRPITALLPGLLLLMLGGCESLQTTDSLLGAVTPYRIDIVQGNVVTKEQIAAIRPGMARNQVRDILGTPLLTDAFHADRWDYVFTIRRLGTEAQRRSVVLRFNGDTLAGIEAPDLPSEKDFVASISRARNVKVPKLELSEEERKALPAPRTAETAGTAPAEPEGPVRTYPPLEPA